MRSPYMIGALWFLGACTPAPESLPEPDPDWDTYLGDSGRRHYSVLDEINRNNVSQLELAWVYDSGELRGSTCSYRDTRIRRLPRSHGRSRFEGSRLSR